MKKFTLLLSVMLLACATSLWAEEFSKTYSYGSFEGWSLTNYEDKSSYYLVPSGNDPSVATIAAIFTGKQVSSNIVITLNVATFGSGTNPSANTFSIYTSSNCDEQVTATQGGTLPTSSTYTDVTYSISQKDAVALTKDLAIKITKPGKQIRLKSIKVEFSYSAASTSPISSIEISGEATKTEYYAGQTFDPTGLVVTATREDETTADVTGLVDWTFNPAVLEESITSVTVSATYKELSTKPVYVDVTVSAAPATKTETIDLSKNETTTATTETLEWKVTILTITSARTNSKNTAANNYYPGTGQSSTRFYKGNTLTFTPADGITLISITYTATSQGYATAMANSAWTNATATAKTDAEPYTVTITPDKGAQAVSATIGATTGGTSFVINYFAEEKPTAIDNATLSTPSVKTIENGQLVILRDGVKYNAMGVRLQ